MARTTTKRSGALKMLAARKQQEAESIAYAELGALLTAHMDALSICSPKDSVRFLREIVVVDRQATFRRMARLCRLLGMGALARDMLEAAL